MVKNIAIMDEVYNLLARNKRQNESFSQEIRRLICKKKSISEFAGAWKMSEKDADEMKTIIRNMKEDTTNHILKKVKRDWS